MQRVSAVRERREGNRLILEDTLVPNPKQRDFYRELARPYSEVEEVLFDGSIRGGKTQAGVRWLVAKALQTGGTYVISRFSYRELEDSTKKVCLYGEGGLPPAIPEQVLWKQNLDKAKNETHNKVKLANGAEILFRALEPKERGKIRNITACGWLIDQAEELDGEDIEDFYQEIKGRCSDPRGPLKLVLIANPGPTDHLIYKRFIDPVTRYEKAARVHVTILDNAKYLPPHYVQMLLATEHTNPDYFKRMVMGEWGAIGGKRFKCWDRNLHVVDRVFDIPEGWEVFEGWDYGWANPTVQLVCAMDYTGRVWVVAEYRASETTVPRICAHAKEIRRSYMPGGGVEPPAERPFFGDLTPSASWLDPSAWAKRGEHSSPAHEFLENEIYVAKANNERVGGWARLETWMTTPMDDGRPRLQIFPTCEGLIKEIPNLRIKPGTEDVEKVNDHSSDALRYVAMSRPITPLEQAQEEDGTREAAARSMVRRASEGREQRTLQTFG
jgi:hypothetical protein